MKESKSRIVERLDNLRNAIHFLFSIIGKLKLRRHPAMVSHLKNILFNSLITGVSSLSGRIMFEKFNPESYWEIKRIYNRIRALIVWMANKEGYTLRALPKYFKVSGAGLHMFAKRWLKQKPAFDSRVSRGVFGYRNAQKMAQISRMKKIADNLLKIHGGVSPTMLQSKIVSYNMARAFLIKYNYPIRRKQMNQVARSSRVLNILKYKKAHPKSSVLKIANKFNIDDPQYVRNILSRHKNKIF